MIKRISALVLAVLIFTFSLSSCASGGEQGIQGEKGERGIQGEKGEQGIQGAPGESGKTGDNGADGRGIVKTEIKDGCLWITYSDDLQNPVNIGKLNNDENEYDLDFYLLTDGTYGVTAGKALYLDKIVIPKSYNGKAVTQILPSAFSGAYYLKEISLPDTIIGIGNSAFFNCPGLKEISIPNGVTFISKQAFAYCASLESVSFSNTVSEIGEQAFRSCTALKEITIGENITFIGKNAFFDCGMLRSAEFVNTSGWTVNSKTISSSELENLATAANYLTQLYSSNDWIRT